jgi:biopolymer transport protein ExbD
VSHFIDIIIYQKKGLILMKIIAFMFAIISLVYLFIKTGLVNIFTKIYTIFLQEFSDLFKEKTDVIKPLFRNIIFAAILLICILIIDLVVFSTNNEEIIGNFGAFGDFMGGILNPVFMFLTLYALIITIIMQKKELKLAREEYSKTANALDTQAIENTFFNTLNLHHKITENVKIDFAEFGEKFLTIQEKQQNRLIGLVKNKQENYNGIKAFDEVINRIFKNKNSKLTLKYYKILQDEHNYIFGHYFRNLYQALKLIDKNNGNNNPKENRYASILRAQLSSGELSLLFLNCLDNVCDSGQFKNLLIKYRMLEHLSIKKKEDKYLLSDKVVVSEEMVFQYLKEKELTLNIKEYAGGAYGNNENISKISGR